MNLPNDCAVVAVCACKFFSDNDIPHKALRLTRPATQKWKRTNHIVTIFEHDGRLRYYDQAGSRDLPTKFHLNSSPTKIAKAIDRRAIKGSWY